jgi:hypothetical protein
MNDHYVGQVNFDAQAILRKRPSLRNERRTEGTGPYLLVEGTLDECLQEFMANTGIHGQASLHPAFVRNSYVAPIPVSKPGIVGGTPSLTSRGCGTFSDPEARQAIIFRLAALSLRASSRSSGSEPYSKGGLI